MMNGALSRDLKIRPHKVFETGKLSYEQFVEATLHIYNIYSAVTLPRQAVERWLKCRYRHQIDELGITVYLSRMTKERKLVNTNGKGEEDILNTRHMALTLPHYVADKIAKPTIIDEKFHKHF